MRKLNFSLLKFGLKYLFRNKKIYFMLYINICIIYFGLNPITVEVKCIMWGPLLENKGQTTLSVTTKNCYVLPIWPKAVDLIYV